MNDNKRHGFVKSLMCLKTLSKRNISDFSLYSYIVHAPAVLPATFSKSSAAAVAAVFSGIPEDALGSKKEYEGSMGAGSGGEWWWAARRGSSNPPR